MAQTQNKKKTSSGKQSASGRSKSGTKKNAPEKKPFRREVGGVVFLLLALLAAVGYFTTDALFIHYFVALLKGLFGYGFYFVPPAFLLTGIILLWHRGHPVRLRVACSLLLVITLGFTLHLVLCRAEFGTTIGVVKELYTTGMGGTSGGVICGGIGLLFHRLFGLVASILVGVILTAVLLMAALHQSPRKIYETAKNRERIPYEPQPEIERPRRQRPENNVSVRMSTPRRRPEIDIPLDDEPVGVQTAREEEQAAHSAKPGFFKKNGAKKPHELLYHENEETVTVLPPVEEKAPVKKAPVIAKITQPQTAAGENDEKPQIEQPSRKETAAAVAAATAAVTREIETKNTAEENPYQYPPYDLLNGEHIDNANEAMAEQKENLQRLINTLESFGIRATAGSVVHGPSVTLYEFALDQGVKLSKVTSLTDDLALALGVSGIRIAPIPEKNSVIGIEVPNKESSMVLVRDVIESHTFRTHKSKVAFAIGRDVAGHDIVGNINKLPHVLIAGTTGSGKSVCINSLIISLLYKSTPDEVRFIMVDPKMVELNPYNGIPHLLIPVVTDPKKAAGALQWAVFEMMKRYKMFSEHNVKDLASYNAMAEKDDTLQKMPFVVVVIDELADLMTVAAKEVEESICRVAQMGRAAGVHLVIATQRPSADVITGLMKANIPSRIAFAVATSIDSRIILDQTGAEKLIGKGDMLYSPVTMNKPLRVQGCMITEEEIDRVVAFVKSKSGEAQYSEEVMQKIEESLVEKDRGGTQQATAPTDDTDPLFDDAVEVLLETGQASVSMLQRRLKLGYSRAARLIDQMEERGVVGPFEGSKPRQLLISRESWNRAKGIDQEMPEETDGETEEESVALDADEEKIEE